MSAAEAGPSHFDGWQHLLLDIDPRGQARYRLRCQKSKQTAAGQLDAVYCSHNLEHYYRHDGMRMLHGFRHGLKREGFVEIEYPICNPSFSASLPPEWIWEIFCMSRRLQLYVRLRDAGHLRGPRTRL